MDLSDVIDEVKENRKVSLRIEKKLIEEAFERKAIEKRVGDLEKRTDQIELTSGKQEDKIKKLENINVKILAIVTGAVWLLGALLKGLFGLAWKALTHP